ncbi:MAG TPA: alginate lyase family protein [Afifellaceae bacterium]|nr:alginate lyase family protein [Afifellaceae bacterium]
MTALIYARTVRHLRPAQLGARLWFRACRPVPDDVPAPSQRPLGGNWAAPIAKPASMTGPRRFTFLNREGEAATAADWSAPDTARLWLYNLHYFDDLSAAGAADRAVWHGALIARWIAENPPGQGPGWEPYPLSLRIVNWVKWAVRTGGQGEAARDSLAAQARHLARRIEWHLMANHLLANAKALVFAGCWFDGTEADGWRETGLGILARELPEQVLADGGHFERSPMYHAIVLEDLLDLVNLARAFPETVPEAMVASWRTAAERMRLWLAAMIHPDGDIAIFNDAAFGVAPRRDDLDAYADRLGLGPAPSVGPGVTHLEASGYVRVEQEDLMAILDVAPVGPDYQPGHAHADTLSFECSVRGRRLVVNGGTSTYEPGPRRAYERSTAAHSTVEIAGENSSEVWAAFRVARRARPFGLNVDERGGEVVVRCAHDGYRRLRGRPVHERTWQFFRGEVRVEDRVAPAAPAVSRLHLHPDWRVAGRDTAGVDVACESRTVRVEADAVTSAEGDWAPEFGRIVPAPVLEMPLAGGRGEARITY